MMATRLATFGASAATVATAVLLSPAAVMAVPPGTVVAAHPTTTYVRSAAHWRVSFLSPGSKPNTLETVAAISAESAWAAGFTFSQGSHPSPPVLRWNGTRWRQVRVPGTSGTDFADVAASSGADVWISATNADTGKNVVRRWDGRRWHSVPSAPGGAVVRVVLSRANAWAEGGIFCIHNLRHCRTTLEHWNGRSWSRFTVPTFVDEMAGSASGNVWVVGEFGGDPTPPATPGRPVSFRWNGKSWRATSMPRPLSFFPASIDVVSRRNVWIGARKATSSGPGPGYALHWNGIRWRRISAPSRLNTVGPVLADGVGVWLGPDAHWTGKRWINTTPGHSFAGGRTVGIDRMALIPGTRSIWAVGAVGVNQSALTFRGLIAIYGTSAMIEGRNPRRRVPL